MLLLLKNILFTVVVPGSVALYIPLSLVAGRSGGLRSPWGLWQAAALLPLATGAAIYSWCLWDFATYGRGTPAPLDAPKRLVIRGLYRYVRNPMYVGVLLVIAGWSLFYQAWGLLAYAFAVGLFFHLFVLLVEEPLLRNRFGEGYLKYCGRVNRWLPGLGRGQDA